MLIEMKEITEVVELIDALRAKWSRVDKALFECLRSIDYPLSETVWVTDGVIALKVGYKTGERNCISFCGESADVNQYSIKTVPIDILNSATDALQEAVNRIADQIQGLKERTQGAIGNLDKVYEKLAISDEPEDQKLVVPSGPITDDTPISALGLDTRSGECLRKANIRTIGDLTRTTEADLRMLRNFGQESARRVRQALSAYGLSLAVKPGVIFEDNGDGIKIEELDLSVRPYNLLKKQGIRTIDRLVTFTESDLLNIPGFGRRWLNEVKERLADRNLVLGKAIEDQKQAD